MYYICSNISLGFYFLPSSGDPVSKRDQPLFGTSVYKNICQFQQPEDTNLTTSSFLGRFGHPHSSETLKKNRLTDSYNTQALLVNDWPHPFIMLMYVELPHPQLTAGTQPLRPGVYWLESLVNGTGVYLEPASIQANTYILWRYCWQHASTSSCSFEWSHKWLEGQRSNWQQQRKHQPFSRLNLSYKLPFLCSVVS